MSSESCLHQGAWCPLGLNETSGSSGWEIFFLVYVTNIWRRFENAKVLDVPTSVVSTHNNQVCNSNLKFFFIDKNTKQHKIQLIHAIFFLNPNPKVELKETSALLLCLPTKKQMICLEIQHHLRMLDLPFCFCRLHIEEHKLQLAQP